MAGSPGGTTSIMGLPSPPRFAQCVTSLICKYGQLLRIEFMRLSPAFLVLSSFQLSPFVVTKSSHVPRLLLSYQMVDTLSVVGFATEGLSICIKVIGILKRYASAVKNVKKDLVALLKRVERMRNVFGLLRSLLLELRKTSQKEMQLEIDKAECENTMNELLTLASNVEKKKQILAGIQWGTKKSSAVRLTEKLREQEEQIINIATIIGT